FRSTLEEVVDADLVLHVVDGSDPFPAEQITAVRRVINDVVADEGVAPPPEVLGLTEVDAIDASRLTERRAMLGAGGSAHGPNS
ncbi:GTPase HflX, partial [Mycobacterium tuberculosis]|nr:GTPase HflX [Mycobacterium tuberculosis]